LIADLREQLRQAQQHRESAASLQALPEDDKICRQHRFIDYLENLGLDTKAAKAHLDRLIAAKSAATDAVISAALPQNQV
jgi:hypothetical protein